MMSPLEFEIWLGQARLMATPWDFRDASGEIATREVEASRVFLRILGDIAIVSSVHGARLGVAVVAK